MSTRLEDLDVESFPSGGIRGGNPGPPRQGPTDMAAQILQQIEEEESGVPKKNYITFSLDWSKALWGYIVVVVLFLILTHPTVNRALAKLLSGSHLFHTHGRLMVRFIQGSILALIYILSTR